MNNDFNIQEGVLIAYHGKDTDITIPESVHTIGEGAFKGMFNITSVHLPNSITTIKKYAFKGCKKLSSINFPQGLTTIEDSAFHRCHALKSAILPNSLTSIGRCVFHYCDNLEVVSIMGVKRFEMQTFANDTNLKELHINEHLDTSNLTDDILTGCVKLSKVVLSNGETYILNNLMEATYSSSTAHPLVKAIAKSVYQSMQLEDGTLYKFHVNLKTFALPEGITCIEKSCFFDKKGIVSVTLPKTLQSIKSQAFKNCINLQEITLLNDNTLIDTDAFKGCNNLTSIVLSTGEKFDISNYLQTENTPKIVKTIQQQILSDFYISGRTLIAYRGNEERVTVPNGITAIGESCFANNESLGRVILPDSVTTIGEYAFKGCLTMQTALLSKQLQSIERSAFEGCVKLLSIELPQTLVKLGNSAFKRCLKLNSVSINPHLQTIEDMAFYGCRSLTSLDIPKGVSIQGDLVFFKSGIQYDTTSSSSPVTDTPTTDDIPPYAFANDDTITEVNISKPCTIGRYAFSNCKNLSSINISNANVTIQDYAFEKCTNLKSVTILAKSMGKGVLSFCRNLENAYIDVPYTLPEESFFGCSSLKSVSLSDNITTLEKHSFDDCISLETFNFKNIQNICEKAFSRCERLKEIDIQKGVVHYHAFEDCSHLESISLSSNVTLKSGAFFGCTNVSNIALDGENYTVSNYTQSFNSPENALPYRVQEAVASMYLCFKVSESLEIVDYIGNANAINIPKDIVSIGDETFRDNLRLESVDIPSSVKRIGRMAFLGTPWLNALKDSQRMVIINNILVDGTTCNSYTEIPASVRNVCGWAFANNYSLESVKFLSPKTTIDEYAFRNCINLKNVTLADGSTYTLNGISDRDNKSLPNTVRNIFRDCINCFKTSPSGELVESTGNIPNLVFANGITSIGESVYKDCNLLESIVLSDDTTAIGNYAFENSKWLKIVKNAYHITTLGNFAFNGCLSLEKIELSNSLQHIGKRCFEHCCNLQEIVIPEGITEIHERTFFRCKSLKAVVLPSTLKVIHKEAFAFCNSLQSVTFPQGLEAIEDRAFAWCESLQSYEIPNNTHLGNEVFFNTYSTK